MLRILIVFFVLAGCRLQQKSSTPLPIDSTCTNRIIEFLGDQWFYNEYQSIYRKGYRFHELRQTSFYADSCFANLSRENLIILFGKPSRESNDQLHYYFDQGCYIGGLFCPSHMIIWLQENGRFKDFEFTTGHYIDKTH